MIVMVMSDDDIRDLIVLSEARIEDGKIFDLSLPNVDQQERRVRADEVGVCACGFEEIVMRVCTYFAEREKTDPVR